MQWHPDPNVDHPCVPVVDYGELRADLFVTTCPWCNSPSQTWVTKDPSSRRENVVGRPGTRDRTLAVRVPGGATRIRSRTWDSGNMVRLGWDDTCAKRTKNFEALGRFITKDNEEGLPGRKWVSLMIDAPFWREQLKNVGTERAIGFETSDVMRRRSTMVAIIISFQIQKRRKHVTVSRINSKNGAKM